MRRTRPTIIPRPFLVLILALSSIIPAHAASRLNTLWLAGGHSDQVPGVAFSADGQLAASAALDGTIKLWRISDGRLLSSVSVPGGDFGFDGATGFNWVRFLPDGQTLLVTGGGGAYIFRISDGLELAYYTSGELGNGAAISPDGTILAVTGAPTGFEEGVTFFRYSDATLLSNPQIQNFGETTDVLFTPDGTHAIASGSTGIHYWRVSDGQLTTQITAHNGEVNALALRPDSQVFASAGEDATIRIWNTVTAAAIRTLTGHTAGVTDLTYSPDGTRIASTSRDGTIRIWNAATGANTRTINPNSGPVLSVAWSPLGDRIITGLADMSVRQWNPDTGAALATLTQSRDRLMSLDVSQNGIIAAGGYGNFIDLRNQSDGSLRRRIQDTNLILGVSLSADGALLADINFDNVTRLWDAATGNLRFNLGTHTFFPNGVGITPDGAKVLAGDFDGPTHIHNAVTGQFIADMPLGENVLSISPDGQLVALASGNLVNLWRIGTVSSVRTIATQPEFIQAVAWSPDSQLLATGGVDNIARIWRVSDGALLRSMTGHIDHIVQLAFSADGLTLASAGMGYDRTLRLWRTADGAPLATFDREIGQGISGIHFSADNSLIICSRLDSTVLAALNPTAFAPGDINGDGSVNAADAQLFVNILLGQSAPPIQRARADLNNDARLDADDVAPFITALLH